MMTGQAWGLSAFRDAKAIACCHAGSSLLRACPSASPPRPATAGAVGIEGELGDGEDRTADIGQAAVHLAVGVVENAKVDALGGKGV